MENAPQIVISKEELVTLVSELVEEKLLEIIGDPDEDLKLKEELISRLKEQKMKVARGERGKSLDEVVKELELF